MKLKPPRIIRIPPIKLAHLFVIAEIETGIVTKLKKEFIRYNPTIKNPKKIALPPLLMISTVNINI